MLDIKALFESGETILEYPVRLIWNRSENPTNTPIQASVSVSKRNFKLAVTRNLLKRRMREAYRLNKHILKDSAFHSNIYINLMIVYIGKTESPYAVIENSIIQSLHKLKKTLLNDI